MRHFRIKETIIGDIVEFNIQYTARFMFIPYWKQYNKLPYKKYEDALVDAKKVINVDLDYTKRKKTKLIKYHYIDAFRLSRNVPATKSPVKRKKTGTNRYNKSTFIPKNVAK